MAHQSAAGEGKRVAWRVKEDSRPVTQYPSTPSAVTSRGLDFKNPNHLQD
jgi:hypothetical protein